MIWITTVIMAVQGFAPVTQVLEFPTQQECEAKRVETAVQMPALQMTVCTPKPPAVVVHTPHRAKH